MKQNEELIARVKTLVTETEKTHRYSMSRIYGLYNEIYNTTEIPQSCASCLIRKVKELKAWLAEQETGKTEITTKKKRIVKKK